MNEPKEQPGGFNALQAPYEDVVKYLTVDLKKKYGGRDEGQRQDSN